MQDEETTLEYIDNKDYSIRIDSSKGIAKPTLSEINVYTDGSKTKQGARAGFVIIAGKSNVHYTQSINLPSEMPREHNKQQEWLQCQGLRYLRFQ